MRRNLVLAVSVAALTTFAASAHAVERCNKPYAPTIQLSPTAAKPELVSLRSDLEAFLEASDLYQKCLLTTVSSGAQIQASQMQKQKAAAEFNTLLRAFNCRSQPAGAVGSCPEPQRLATK